MQVRDLLLLHKHQPMLVPPLPWRSLDSGGHVLTRSFLMRIVSNQVHRQALLKAQHSGTTGLSKVGGCVSF